MSTISRGSEMQKKNLSSLEASAKGKAGTGKGVISSTFHKRIAGL